MAKTKAVNPSEPLRKIRPALTPDARENQLTALAYDLVERRLINGTASSQETTHFLKLGSSTAKLEKEIMEKQKELMAAKTENLQSSKRIEALYADAMRAMKRYSGSENPNDDY